MCGIKPHVSRTVKKKNFVFSIFFTFICLTTEEKARKNLHSVCCTANIVIPIILRVCVTRGKKVLLHLLPMLSQLLILIRPLSYFIYI